jgi:hypothetical protein
MLLLVVSSPALQTVHSMAPLPVPRGTVIFLEDTHTVYFTFFLSVLTEAPRKPT